LFFNVKLIFLQKTGESNHQRHHKHDEDDGNSSARSSSSSTSDFLALFNNTSYKQNASPSTTLPRASVPSLPSYSTNDPCQQAMRDEWWYEFYDNSAEFNISLSGKLTFLKTLLEECEQIGDKVLLFSRSLYSLSYLEQYLKYWDSTTTGKKIQADDFDAKAKPNSRWKFGIDYFRIDGERLIFNKH
jgi:transcriptional regulator ATRX